MTTLYRLLALTLFSFAASAVNAAEPTSTGAADTQPVPIPTLHCEIKSVMACSPDGTCKSGTDDEIVEHQRACRRGAAAPSASGESSARR